MKWGFEDFTLDSEAFELRKGDEPLAAEPQVIALLILLVENRGRLLKKDEIIDSIWNGRAISDAALSSRVKSARQLIGDTGKEQRLIKTVYGNGFRFVGNVETETPSGNAPLPDPASGPSVVPSAGVDDDTSSTRFRLTAGIIVTLLAIAILTLVWLFVRSQGADNQPADGEVVVAVVPLSSSGEQALGKEIAGLLVTRLSDRSDFVMLSSTSSFTLAERGMTATQIADELGATHVLEGELRNNAGLYNVDLRLIDGSGQRQIWSHTVQTDVEDKSLLVDKAVRHAAAAIQVYLEVGAGRVDVPAGTPPTAIRDYRIGLAADLTAYRRQTGLEKHLLFDSARKQAPNWADAHGAYAWTTLFTRPTTIALESDEQLALVREAIASAKEIDPENRWGRLADGVYQTRYGSDFTNALEVLSDLVSDEPDWPLARRMYAQALLTGGHYREAVAQFEQIDALNGLPTWVGGFIRSHALRGMGNPMSNAVLAQSCEAQCFWIFVGWYDAILLKEHETKRELESDLAQLVSVIKDQRQDVIAVDLGVGENVTGRMTETALFLKGYGPSPEQPFGSTPTLIKVAVQSGNLDTAFDQLDVYQSDWMPATAVFDFLYDDALRTPDVIRADHRYHAVFARPRVKAVADYRRAQGLTAGLPIDE